MTAAGESSMDITVIWTRSGPGREAPASEDLLKLLGLRLELILPPRSVAEDQDNDEEGDGEGAAAAAKSPGQPQGTGDEGSEEGGVASGNADAEPRVHAPYWEITQPSVADIGDAHLWAYRRDYVIDASLDALRRAVGEARGAYVQIHTGPVRLAAEGLAGLVAMARREALDVAGGALLLNRRHELTMMPSGLLFDRSEVAPTLRQLPGMAADLTLGSKIFRRDYLLAALEALAESSPGAGAFDGAVLALDLMARARALGVSGFIIGRLPRLASAPRPVPSDLACDVAAITQALPEGKERLIAAAALVARAHGAAEAPARGDGSDMAAEDSAANPLDGLIVTLVGAPTAGALRALAAGAPYPAGVAAPGDLGWMGASRQAVASLLVAVRRDWEEAAQPSLLPPGDAALVFLGVALVQRARAHGLRDPWVVFLAEHLVGSDGPRALIGRDPVAAIIAQMLTIGRADLAEQWLQGMNPYAQTMPLLPPEIAGTLVGTLWESVAAADRRIAHLMATHSDRDPAFRLERKRLRRKLTVARKRERNLRALFQKINKERGTFRRQRNRASRKIERLTRALARLDGRRVKLRRERNQATARGKALERELEALRGLYEQSWCTRVRRFLGRLFRRSTTQADDEPARRS